jgi:NAD(P)H-hydrate epimerase
VAVDLPSGLDGNGAAIMGPHVQAELTVTFGAPKIAHVLLPAAAAVGDVVVADLGIPTELIDRAAGDLHLLTDETMAGHLSPRPLASHKGDFGHAVIVAGSVGKAGAAILAARGAVRSGAGLVTVATPAAVAQTVDLGSLESMTLPLSTDEGGGLSEETAGEILEFARGKQVLSVGPGLGTAPSTVRVIRSIVVGAEIPVVLDADGLNAFAGSADQLAEGGEGRVLTPHPGELARLLGVTTEEIQRDRVASARTAASQTRSVVVLKGHQTLIADPAGSVFINPTGNPGMATGGTGDVLTGVLTGLLSQGLDLVTAACLAAFVHGSAGDHGMVESGQEGLTAGDLLEHLSAAFRQIRP